MRTLLLFETLNSKELKIVDGLLHERKYLKEEVVFDTGEEGQALYIILSGKILICHQGQPETGKIAELEQGRLFGELALLDNSPRSTQTRALEDSTLAVFFRDDFLGLLETHAVIASKISLQLARHIGRRLRETVSSIDGRIE
ncbi:MAG: cyclic nucleotide-binding domain-containing protein [Leptospiraceae bacterium]|nr:cyclic nucleotide-binding domain-containing protein [Leptospiraceae bacterium]